MRTHMKNLKNKLHISNLKKEEFDVDPNFDFSDFIEKHYDSVLMLKVGESTNAYDNRIIEIHINMLVCLGFKMIMLLYYTKSINVIIIFVVLRLVGKYSDLVDWGLKC